VTESFSVLLDQTIGRLRAAGVASPEADAWSLLAAVTGVNRGELQAKALIRPDIIDAAQQAQLEQWVSRRESREPLWHITGVAPFLELELEVGPGVFTPRPETELLAHQAIAEAEVMVPTGSEVSVVDLCAGSGAIGLAIAHRVAHTRLLAVESSLDAAHYLRHNASRYAPGRSDILVADIADVSQRVADHSVDVVVSNPPYLVEGVDPLDVETTQCDPPEALFSPGEGLDVIRRVVDISRRILRPGGVVFIEHGIEHGEATRQALGDAGFRHPQTELDLLGRERFSRAVAPGQ
jgi:release factor glutamine methyltransferase